MRRSVSAVLFVLLAQACAHMGPRPQPLYPGPERPAQEVAILSGPVKTVDGLDVSEQGTVFALEPGCHVVALEPRIGEGGVSGAWSAVILRPVYAFRMAAGNNYVVNVRVLPGNQGVGTANVGGVKVTAVEQDSQGRRIRTLAPVRREADIEACQAWAPGVPGQSQVAHPEEPFAEPDAAVPQPGSAIPDAGAGG